MTKMRRLPAIVWGASALLATLVSAPASIRGVIIELKDGHRIGAKILKENAAQLVIIEHGPGGVAEERTLERKLVERIIQTIDPKRLEELKPTAPEAYREYAEEIAPKKNDPEARELALRLYLIAAYHDRKNLGRSCLRAMAELAETPEESRRYQAMAFALDPQRQGTEPKIEPFAVLNGSAASSENEVSSNDFLRCLRAFRDQKAREAAILAKKPASAQGFVRYRDVLTREAFLEACASRMTPQSMTADQARREEAVSLAVQRVEAREIARGIPVDKLNIGGAAGAAGDKDHESWSLSAYSRGLAPVRPLDLETIANYDPRESLYRAGRWVKP